MLLMYILIYVWKADTISRTPVPESKMGAVARAYLTFPMLVYLDKPFEEFYMYKHGTQVRRYGIIL